jgi:FKBP-type peptidyl-prolyl cis-trans isomerase FklB
VVTTASGLQYEILTQGNGPIPTVTDTVIVNYIGKLINGSEFENSYNSGGVIKGWTEALLMMPAGSKWRVYIPQQLGYGTMESPVIPAGSALIFDIELIEIQGRK